MPLQISRLDGRPVAHVRETDAAAYSDWARLNEDVAPGKRLALLADVRDRTSLPSSEEARQRASLATEWFAVAILARPGAQYGMARVMAANAEGRGIPVRVFTDVDQAREWLAQLAPDEQRRRT